MSHLSNDTVKTTARSLAISVVLAVAVYVLTGQVLFGLAVVGVASAVAVASLFAQRQTRRPAEDEVAPGEACTAALKRALLHDRLLVRFAALFALSAGLFVAAWSLGYYLLPEGVLRSDAPAIVAGPAPTLMSEVLSILGWNLTLPVVIIVLANVALRINGYPLGYFYPLFNAAMYGLTLGTNSFAVPMPERMAPSLAVLERAGPYEFAGYVLIVVATYSLARFEIPNFFQGNLQRLTPVPALRLTREQWVGVALGVLIVALAGLREAMMIVAL